MVFVKLFSSITESTIWDEDAPTKIVWITMLAMSDRHGLVWSSAPGLANRARVTLPEVKRALGLFLAPDPESRTQEHEGRRIEIVDGGWRLLNHGKYRQIRNEEERRLYKTIKQREYRAAVDKPVDSVDPSGHIAEAEADTDTELKKKKKKKKATPPSPSEVEGLNLDAWGKWLQYRTATNKPKYTTNGGAIKLAKLPYDAQMECVESSIDQAYVGLFPDKFTGTSGNGRKKTYAEELKDDMVKLGMTEGFPDAN